MPLIGIRAPTVIKNYLDRKFLVYKRGSTLSIELFTGLTTYLSLSFVFILNPTILGAAHADASGVTMSPASILLATALTSSLATIAMGLFANLPLAVGPGIEVSAFFTYILVNRIGLTWEEALLAVSISGVLNVILTAMSVRRHIIESIPDGLKFSLLLTIGCFVLLVGLKLGNIVDISSRTRWLFLNREFWETSYLSKGPFVLLIGLFFTTIFNIRRLGVPWGSLVGIIVGALASHIVGIQPPDYQLFGSDRWYQTFFKVFDVSPSAIDWVPFIGGVVVLFVIDFVGGISKISALASGTAISRQNGEVPGLKSALYVDGAATLVGGVCGTSSLIAFVESEIGIQAGGRTGIMSIVCGMLMLAGGIFSGLLVLVPPQAAAGVLVYVGIWLIRVNWKIIRSSATEGIDVVLTIVMSAAVLLTFQFDYAMMIGFLAYFVVALLRGASFRSVFWLGLVAAILMITTLFQFSSIF